MEVIFFSFSPIVRDTGVGSFFKLLGRKDFLDSAKCSIVLLDVECWTFKLTNVPPLSLKAKLITLKKKKIKYLIFFVTAMEPYPGRVRHALDQLFLLI